MHFEYSQECGSSVSVESLPQNYPCSDPESTLKSLVVSKVETKLEKVNQFSYREPYKGESSFKWLKAFHPLDMRLTDVQVILGLSVQQPLAWNPFFWKEAEARASLTDDRSSSSNEEAQEKYSDHIGWRLSATGYFIKDRID